MLTFQSGSNGTQTRLQLRYNTTDGLPLTDAELDQVIVAVAATYPDDLLPIPADIEFDASMEPVRDFAGFGRDGQSEVPPESISSP